jgi:Holliday junction resolvase RusA-like endonuclease
VIAFDVPGIPAPKGSWKTFGRGKLTRFVNDNPKTAPWVEAVRLCGKQAARGRVLNGALKVTIEFRLPRPKTVKREHPSAKPDIDKLTRSTFDALNGVCFVDDGRVVEVTARKVYAIGETGARITIEEIP